MIGFLIGLVVIGLVVGALGRLAIPGPTPMSIPVTIAIGVGASLVAGLLGNLILGRPFGLIVSVLIAAGIIYFMQRQAAGGNRRL